MRVDVGNLVPPNYSPSVLKNLFDRIGLAVNALTSGAPEGRDRLAAAPTTGTWGAGHIIWNSAPSAGGTVGWVCVTSGTPGTWKAFGTIAA